MKISVPNVSIAWKLILYIIGITTLLALIGLAFNYYIHYKAEIKRVAQSRHEIVNSQVPLLAAALWNFEFSNIRIQLEGLLNSRHIHFVELESSRNKFTYGAREKRDDFLFEFPLIHDQAGRIGTLKIQYSLRSIKRTVLDELFIIAVAVVLQMVIMVLLIIWMFKLKITRHLIALGRYAKEISTENLDKGFEFCRKSFPRFRDELDYLGTAMDQMRRNMLRQLQLKNEMEEQLRRAQKMEAIGTLAGGIAHDFNNILGAIIGYSELVSMDLAEGSRAKQNIVQVLQAGNRAKDLVNQILTFSRQTEQQRKPTYIGPIVKEALKLLRASLPSTIEIEQHIENEKDAIVVDPTQIYQVLMNLCTNSAHAMGDKGGKLEVGLNHITIDPKTAADHTDLIEGRYLLLTVRDSGHGIKPDILGRIFDPYYTTKGPGEGTGLGLAVAHGIVTAHGGSIKVESQSGKGTAFYVYLPAGVSPEVPEEDSLQENLKKGRERILFIDDEAPIAQLGKALLENLGYRATAYTDALKALEHFRNQPDQYDAVITDLTMPKMTGDLLAKALTSIRPDIPIILCTGFSFQENPGSGMAEFGVRRLLKKPFSLAHLSDALRAVLDEGTS